LRGKCAGRHADEALPAGDVITPESGLYVPDVGGVRIEHTNLIPALGYEQLSNHAMALR
jgi:Xaa-Pro aminopeptidase